MLWQACAQRIWRARGYLCSAKHLIEFLFIFMNGIDTYCFRLRRARSFRISAPADGPKAWAHVLIPSAPERELQMPRKR